MFSLALELKMTVGQLLSVMDSYELSEWAAYFNLQNSTETDTSNVAAGDNFKARLLAYERERGKG